MTKITRERLEQLADEGMICKLSWDERIELARIALASLVAEPVGEFYEADPGQWYQRSLGDKAPKWTPLYIAPPAPVVPEGYALVPIDPTDEIIESIAYEARCCGGIASDIYGAMLAAAPKP